MRSFLLLMMFAVAGYAIWYLMNDYQSYDHGYQVRELHGGGEYSKTRRPGHSPFMPTG